MVEGVLIAIVGSLTSVAGAAIGFYGGKRKDKISERELLSKDEQAFRLELREELRVYKEEISGLRQEVARLSIDNLALLTENKLLNMKVQALVERLPRQSTDNTRQNNRGWDDEETV